VNRHVGHIGLFAGVVSDNDDPDGKCRIKVEVPEVLDGTTGWCFPALPYAGDQCGLAVVPPIGAAVYVQWPRGDLSAPPVWSGANFSGGSGVPGAGPNTVILLTPGGHRVELSDDNSAVTVTASTGAKITLDNSGVAIDNGQGATISMQGSQIDINNGALTVM
jgi:uncharacterized protein involved in type VI secretion and phage assembly